jgi:hypothetical protein
MFPSADGERVDFLREAIYLLRMTKFIAKHANTAQSLFLSFQMRMACKLTVGSYWQYPSA